MLFFDGREAGEEEEVGGGEEEGKRVEKNTASNADIFDADVYRFSSFFFSFFSLLRSPLPPPPQIFDARFEKLD